MRDVTVGEYILEALEERLHQDLPDERAGMLSMNAASDPLLSDLWDNPRDARYDES